MQGLAFLHQLFEVVLGISVLKAIETLEILANSSRIMYLSVHVLDYSKSVKAQVLRLQIGHVPGKV